jgi:hypothetical protein
VLLREPAPKPNIVSGLRRIIFPLREIGLQRTVVVEPSPDIVQVPGPLRAEFLGNKGINHTSAPNIETHHVTCRIEVCMVCGARVV